MARISSESSPVYSSSVINAGMFNFRDKRELIGDPVPSLSFADQGWFARFLLNLLGYSIILVPGALTVFMVKNKLCLPQGKKLAEIGLLHRALSFFSSFNSLNFYTVQSFPLIRLFVYGKEKSTHVHDDVELQSNPEDSKIHGDTGTSGTNFAKTLKLAYCFVGLQISFLAWGLLQEKIMTTEYVVRPTSSSSSDTKGNLKSLTYR